MNDYKQNAIAFVSKIPQFQRNLALLDNFLESLDYDQQQKLLHFLKENGLLYKEETLSGDYSCKTGILFNQLTISDIPLFINDLKNGKYDAYF